MSDQKTVLVTGANIGVGFEIVRQLLGKGFRVFLTARNAIAGEKAASSLQVDDRFLQMDVTDDTSIENAGSATCVMLKPSEKYHGRPSCVAE